MIKCDQLIHPFQSDPGTSQKDRILADLLSGSGKIDGRTLADLLHFFQQLSRHINYYDQNLNISDWQLFFKKSLPFTLSSIVKYDAEAISEKFGMYNKIFEKHPSSAGLQLNLHFLYYNTIYQINSWHLIIKGSGLPIESTLEKLIRDRLSKFLKEYIMLMNLASKWSGVKRIEFFKLSENSVWGLQITDLFATNPCFGEKIKGKRKRLLYFYQRVVEIFPAFTEAMSLISSVAEASIEQSLFPINEELQKQHAPHLGLLFAFLKLFQHLQSDLNSYSKKHLDFFYKDVLQLTSKGASPDSAHIIVEIQKNLKKYLLGKGLLLKDGKDNNKADVLFVLDDELVVNKTQVAEIKTLFLNNIEVNDLTFVEGIYCAPKANAADGIDKEFADTAPANYSTLGAKHSKYIEPGKETYKVYPSARTGFILASPVLLLNEGMRTVNISIALELKNPLCSTLTNLSESKSCCGTGGGITNENTELKLLSAKELYPMVKNLIKLRFVYINEDLIAEAAQKGIAEDIIEQLTHLLPEKNTQSCYGEHKVRESEVTLTYGDWFVQFWQFMDEDSKKILSLIFKPRRVFKILFSGEKAWLEPGLIEKIEQSAYVDTGTSFQFFLKLKVIFTPDQPAITYFNKETLKEDFDTTLPLMRVELDDNIKIFRGFDKKKTNCCKKTPPEGQHYPISFYHFFRDVTVINRIGPEQADRSNETQIHVKVCGLKNIVVQNDDNVMDVNSLVYPFGVRPKIDSGFYIGSKEIFSKNWQNLKIDLNWKDFPPGTFEDYYNGYQTAIPNTTDFTDVVKDNNFKVKFELLQDGSWIVKDPVNFPCSVDGSDTNNLLFASGGNIICAPLYDHWFYIERTDFQDIVYPPLDNILPQEVKRFDVNSRHFFLKLSLKCQDFRHDRYPLILARQMMAFGKLPDTIVDGAVYFDGTNYKVISSTALLQEYKNAVQLSTSLRFDVGQIDTKVGNVPPLNDPNFSDIVKILRITGIFDTDSLVNDSISLNEKLLEGEDTLDELTKYAAVIPKEPWTPILKNISLDYTATAFKEDIDLIHLYPFAGTYKSEEIALNPPLFPTHCFEGSLFLALKDLEPGSNVNILFQLAEATADSEAGKEDVLWYYLENNLWKSLRPGFEIVEDATNGLTTSGIIKFSMPENIGKENTILPSGYHWIKASILENSKTISETFGIHTQAVKVTFTNDEANDKLRLSEPLAAESIAKLLEADASVKKISQPYESFSGRIPEEEGHYYLRVSELLRHKGRSIQKFDYERMVLEAFPVIYKAKCINHSFGLDAHLYKNDFPAAPGYVLLAVIPDLTMLDAGNSFAPKAPVSLLEQIEAYLKKRTSPFVRLAAMNPRYEEVDFCLKVKLVYGKDENYYKEKLRQDLKEFLAPWAIGEFEKLTFGQPVVKSDIVGFIETRDYVDYIIDFQMGKAPEGVSASTTEVKPQTPRSILIGGSIDVCVCQDNCVDWDLQSAPCDSIKEPIGRYCTDRKER